MSSKREALMLTPLIRAGQITEAQSASRVSFSHLIDGDSQIESHSGFLSVSETRHLFFWFFPHPDPFAPLILWLQGGPGESSLFGLFTEHGPFIIEDPSLGKVSRRPFAWTKTHSVIYCDSPVGAGFSYTETEDGYAKSQDDVARDLYEALRQFFRLFPQQKLANFYIGGESYGGKYVPSITRKIHIKNQRVGADSERINLRGMLIGNAFTDPLSVLDYGNYLYNLGMLGVNERNFFQGEEEKIRQLILQGEFVKAFHLMDKLVFGTIPENGVSHFVNLTGIRTPYNITLEEDPSSQLYFIDFVQRESVRAALHVGDRPFNYNDMGGPVCKGLEADICQSTKPAVEEILNAEENYHVLFYTGQLDVACAEPLAHRLLQNLDWKSTEEFKKSKRGIWRDASSGKVSGYAQSFGGLTQVLIRNAGHRVPADQSEVAFDMVNRFTTGASFTT